MADHNQSKNLDPQFQPKWPHSVSGKDWRSPLHDEKAEALSVRADTLYRVAPLSHVERGYLIRVHGWIEGHDDALLRHAHHSNLARPASRNILSAVEYIERLERKHFGRAHWEAQSGDDI